MTSLGLPTPRDTPRLGDGALLSGAAPTLWTGLAAPQRRRLPTKGFDVLGERTLGWLRRLRARRLEWNRAEAIIERAGRLSSCADAELDRAIAATRERAMLTERDRGAIDEAFAVGYEVIRREIGLSLHPVQVLAGLAMHRGCCVELATGEGKTVTAILPAAIDAWRGRGVHVVTVNDYLARRDAETTGAAYRRLGLAVGVIQETSTPRERRAAYARCVTYAADKQVLFDHLRDRLLAPLAPRLARLILEGAFPGGAIEHDTRWGERVVQRGHYSAIVDEADSVLIDDAVTPAIISGEPESDTGRRDESPYRAAADIAREFIRGRDYTLDARRRHVRLTPAGTARAELATDRLPEFWRGPRRREELLVQAVTARELFTLGDDYVVQDGDIQIVDRSTGRILPGRQWQLGMHQAVQAKEGLAITPVRATSARSSYQAFFQRYTRLAGMTGTAREVAPELWRWYRLPVARVPTHRPVARKHHADRCFASDEAKWRAVARRVGELHAAGRPVLVGTRSVNASEHLARLLATAGVPCTVLNATHESEEAEIIARAGESGAVTVATNMAGRGTDIRLSDRSRELGGLAVIATERHDEPRVDRQLYGRAGRQGDPGSAEALISLDDQLFRAFAPRPLARAARLAPGPLRTPAAGLARRAAQWSASRHWAALRAESARADAFLDTALHSLTR